MPAPRVKLAGATGLEPATSCVTGRRANQLNYAPAYNAGLILSGSDSLSRPFIYIWPCRDSWRFTRRTQRNQSDRSAIVGNRRAYWA